MTRALLAAALLALACAVRGAPSGDPALEQRIRSLEEKLRCLVCQNQTLADSNAELAEDLRRQVREQIAQGRSDAQIIDYLVQRYGDFVLYDPPFKASTALLWTGPFALLAGAAGALAFIVKRRRRLAEQPALTADEKQLADRILGRDA